MCPLAEGTDLGGSLRGPASYCGVVGFRTTPGLIPRYPSVLAWDTYSVEGPMARTIDDTALMLSVMAGPDDRSPISYEVDARELSKAAKAPSVKGTRIAWTADLGGLMTIDDEVRAVFERAVAIFRSAGAKLEPASPDMSDVPEIVRLTRGLLMVARHADKLPEHRAVLQEGLVENTEQGLALTSRDVARGELLRTRLWQRVREFLTTRDLLITPTSAMPPFPIEQAHALEINGKPVGRILQRSYLTYAFSVLGVPAISIPCGFTSQGLPVGLQIIGRRRGEASVLRAAAAFEAAQPWAAHVPAIVRRAR
jgi:amidase